MTEIYSEPFSISRSEPCFCQSGKKAKACCASLAKERQPPHGVHVSHNICSEEFRQSVINVADAAPKERLMRKHIDPVTGEISSVVDEVRITNGVYLGENQKIIDNWIRTLWLDVVQPATGETIEWFETPSLMCYDPGGLFQTHADNGYLDRNNNRYVTVLNRDLSMLVYINSDFEGGNISFNHFNYSYKPQGGDLIFFPSDQRYTHTAEKVTAGKRYCIVSWAAVKGGVRPVTEPPENANLIKRPWWRRFLR